MIRTSFFLNISVIHLFWCRFGFSCSAVHSFQFSSTQHWMTNYCSFSASSKNKINSAAFIVYRLLISVNCNLCIDCGCWVCMQVRAIKDEKTEKISTQNICSYWLFLCLCLWCLCMRAATIKTRKKTQRTHRVLVASGFLIESFPN